MTTLLLHITHSQGTGNPQLVMVNITKERYIQNIKTKTPQSDYITNRIMGFLFFRFMVPYIVVIT